MDEENKANDEKPIDEKPPEAPKPPRVRVAKPPSVGPGNEPAAPLSPAQATDAGEDTVPMVFSKEVVLTDDHHKRIRFPIGLVNVPAHLAEHWYLAANGAKRAATQRPQQPTE